MSNDFLIHEITLNKKLMIFMSLTQVATEARRASALSEISFLRAASSADDCSSRVQSGENDTVDSGKDLSVKVTAKHVSGARFGSGNAVDSSGSGLHTLSSRPSSSGTKQLEQVEPQRNEMINEPEFRRL
jgi:hypothetical protein